MSARSATAHVAVVMICSQPIVKPPTLIASLKRSGSRHALLARRDRGQEDVLDDHREREAREQERQEAGAPQRPEGDALHEHRRDRGRGDRRRHLPGKGHALEVEQVHGVGGDGDELAVGEVDEAEDREHHRETERQQRVGRSERQRVDRLLDRLLREVGERDHEHADSQVGALDLRGGAQLGGRPLALDLAAGENVRAVGELERAVHVLLDEQDGGSLLAQPCQELEDLVDENRCEAERGLVEQEQLRAGHERAPDGEHLLLAAGKRPRHLPGALAQDREELEDPLPCGGHGGPVALGHRPETEVVGDGEAREHAASLRGQREAALDDSLGREPLDLLAAEANAAAGRGHEARDGVQEARFAGAVRAEQGDDLALPDAKRDLADRDDGAVADEEALDGEKVIRQRPPVRCSSGRWLPGT